MRPSEAGRRAVEAEPPASAHRVAARARLTREELGQLRWVLGGIVTLLSLGAVLYLEVETHGLMAAAALVTLAGLVRPAWLARVPRWVHRLAFPAIAAGFAADLWWSGEVLPAMVRLDLLLLLYRGLAYRQRRDDLQVIVLGLFLIVVTGVLTVSPTFAVQILAFTAAALVFLLVITLGEADPTAGAAPPGRGAPAWARHVGWRSLARRVRAATDGRVVALAAGLFAALVGMSALLFLAIPRFQLENSLFLERFITKKARTGFSETIRFGDVTEIAQDNGVALSVDVSDRAAIPARPYWRMLVLDEYRDGTFRLSPGLRRMAFSPERRGVMAAGAGRRARGEPVFWTFYLESGVSRYLPLLGGFDAVQFREAQYFRVAPALGLVALRDEPATMTAYRVESRGEGEGMRDPAFALRWREHNGNPRAAGGLMLRLGLEEADRAVLGGIAREIAGGEELGATEFARRATAWLGARHAYSLQPHVPTGPGDPLVRWMVSREGGHCELFAGALVLLAREAGFPARMVTGFRGGSWNGYSNNFTLRNADAHAWCEVFEAETGAWRRVDPTPGASAGAEDVAGEAALARRVDRSWTARLDSLRVFWYRRIVSFDQRDQVEGLRAAKVAAEDSGRRLREVLARWSTAVREWLAAPWSGGKALGILVGAALVAALGGGAWAGWRWRWTIMGWRGRGRAGGGEAVRREAGRWLGRIAATAQGGETVELRAARAELQRLRFGARETWPEIGGAFRRARRAWREARRSG